MLRVAHTALVRPRTVAPCLSSLAGTTGGGASHGSSRFSTATRRPHTRDFASALGRAPAAVGAAPHCAGLRADARSACVRFSPAPAVLQWRTYIRGGATASGTAAFAEKNRALNQFMQLPQARGWLVSRMGWGGDDVGKPLDVRYRALWQAVHKGGCNVIRFDVDSVLERLARYDKSVGSSVDSAPASSQDGADSDAAGATASDAEGAEGAGEEADAAPKGGGKRWGSGVRPYDEMAEDIVWEANALTQMFQRGIDRTEVVIIARLSLEAGIAVDDIARVVAERTEAALDGLGLEMADVLMVHVPDDAKAFGDDHLRELLTCLDLECEELPGSDPLTKDVLAELSDSDGDKDDMPLAQYFGISSARFARSPEQRGTPLASILKVPVPCLAVEFPWHVFDPWPAQPVQSGNDKEPRSVLDDLHRAGLWSMARKPFDTEIDGKPVRCVQAPDTAEYDEKFLQKMEETLNQCVHLEGRFDEVMAAAASVRQTKEAEADVLMPELPDPADAKFGHMIAANWNALDSVIQWEHLWGSTVSLAVHRVVQSLGSYDVARDWAYAYKVSMFTLNTLLLKGLSGSHTQLMDTVARRLDVAASAASTFTSDDAASDIVHPPSVQHRVSRLLLSAGVGTVLSEEVSAFPLVPQPPPPPESDDEEEAGDTPAPPPVLPAEGCMELLQRNLARTALLTAQRPTREDATGGDA